MQKQWDQLAILTFLESLPLEYTLAHPQVIGCSIVDSLPETLISSKCLSGGITKSFWEHEKSALAVQQGQFITPGGGRGGCCFASGRGDLVVETSLVAEGVILVVEEMKEQRIDNKI